MHSLRLPPVKPWQVIAAVGLVVAVLVGVALALTWANSQDDPVPLVTPPPVGVPQTDAARITAAATQQAAAASAAAAERSSRRTLVVALGAGMLALSTLIISALTYSQAQRQHATERVDARFAQAIEHLADGKNESVRIGGLYTLEAVARADPTRRAAILEILDSFTADWREECATNVASQATSSPGDVSAADIITARLNDAHRLSPNLHCAWLFHADLRGAYLVEAILLQANLSGATLTNADLTRAELIEASLSGVRARDAAFIDADLTHAKVHGADLRGARLDGAKLIGADLTNADLKGADISNTDLTGATLGGCNLTEAIGYGTHPSHLV